MTCICSLRLSKTADFICYSVSVFPVSRNSFSFRNEESKKNVILKQICFIFKRFIKKLSDCSDFFK